MHIAVCDDNVADRKQTERLLGRESDSRIRTTGNLYIDSYGNVESLKQAPMKYDLFFIDMTESGPDGAETAALLRQMGVTSPIVLMISKIDYRRNETLPADIFFLEKPVKKAELTALLDKALSILESRPRTIELRDESKTLYLLPDRILYAVPEKNGVKVILTNEEEICHPGTMEDLGSILAPFEPFLLISGKYIININHVVSIKKRTVTMSNGTQLKAGFTEWKSLLSIVSGRGSRFLSD